MLLSSGPVLPCFAALDVVRKVAGEDNVVEQGAQRTLELLLHLCSRLAHVVGLTARGLVGEDTVVGTLKVLRVLVLGLTLAGWLERVIGHRLQAGFVIWRGFVVGSHERLRANVNVLPGVAAAGWLRVSGALL